MNQRYHRLVFNQARCAPMALVEAHRHTEKGFLSKKTITTRDRLDQTTALATTFSGDTVTVQAGRDLTVTGSDVVADRATALAAGNNLSLEAATQTRSEAHLRDEKKSGLFSSGGIGFTLGTQQRSTGQQGDSTPAAGSTVGSLEGNVLLQADNAYRQAGSDVLAPQGDIAIEAREIHIVEAREIGQTSTETRFKQSGCGSVPQRFLDLCTYFP